VSLEKRGCVVEEGGAGCRFQTQTCEGEREIEREREREKERDRLEEVK
jgi:hypothetical protein